MLLPDRSENPFPGIRSFESTESHFFHGRKEHTEHLLRQLRDNRLLAVVGSSGSGKSSLVKAGLLPRLHRGHMQGTTSRWRTVVLRPGAHPLLALAQALAGSEIFALSVEQVASELERSSLGLVKLAEKMPGRHNLLIVADQFEEIFRFRRQTEPEDGGREASLFVELLLQAAQYEVPIYVVLTMRSDYLGDCAKFSGLPEALNRAQYLIPSMNRRQRTEAIVLPLEAVGVGIEPALVQRLLNDVGENPDQLPALQHSLMVLFDAWQQSKSDKALDHGLYTAERQVGSSLDSHATAIMDSLPPSSRKTTEHIFRTLTTVEDGRPIRRPTRLGDIFEILSASSEADREQTREVIRLYVAPGNSLLVSSTRQDLNPDSIIDITHETLIQQWSLLKTWVSQENENAKWLLRIVSSAELYEAGMAGHWSNPEAEFAWNLSLEHRWNSAWARQYCDSFDEAMEFLAESRRKVKDAIREEEERRTREIHAATALVQAKEARANAEHRARVRLGWASVTLALALIVSVVLAVELRSEKQRAQEGEHRAVLAEKRARVAENMAKALQQQATASLLTNMAVQSRETNSKESERLLVERDNALANAQEFEKKARELERQVKEGATLRPTDPVLVEKVKSLEAQVSNLQSQVRNNLAEIAKLSASANQVEALRQIHNTDETRLKSLDAQVMQLKADLASAKTEQDRVAERMPNSPPTSRPGFVRISAGTFTRDCFKGEPCESGKSAPVTIDREFLISKAEVSVLEYRAFSGAAVPTSPNFNRDWRFPNGPIVNITWFEAAAYCASIGGRLPTEAEIEYAETKEVLSSTDRHLSIWTRDWLPHPQGKIHSSVVGGTPDWTNKIVTNSGSRARISDLNRDGLSPTARLATVGCRCVLSGGQ